MQDEEEQHPSEFECLCGLVGEHLLYVCGFVWHIQVLRLFKMLMYCSELTAALSGRKPVNTAGCLKER